MGTVVPVEISVYEDRSFTFITKTPPAGVEGVVLILTVGLGRSDTKSTRVLDIFPVFYIARGCLTSAPLGHIEGF